MPFDEFNVIAGELQSSREQTNTHKAIAHIAAHKIRTRLVRRQIAPAHCVFAMARRLAAAKTFNCAERLHARWRRVHAVCCPSRPIESAIQAINRRAARIHSRRRRRRDGVAKLAASVTSFVCRMSQRASDVKARRTSELAPPMRSIAGRLQPPDGRARSVVRPGCELAPNKDGWSDGPRT